MLVMSVMFVVSVMFVMLFGLEPPHLQRSFPEWGKAKKPRRNPFGLAQSPKK